MSEDSGVSVACYVSSVLKRHSVIFQLVGSDSYSREVISHGLNTLDFYGGTDLPVSAIIYLVPLLLPPQA